MEKNRAGNAYTDMNLIFCTELGNFYEPRNFLRLVYTLCKRAGIDRINVHTLRHYIRHKDAGGRGSRKDCTGNTRARGYNNYTK